MKCGQGFRASWNDLGYLSVCFHKKLAFVMTSPCKLMLGQTIMRHNLCHSLCGILQNIHRAALLLFMLTWTVDAYLDGKQRRKYQDGIRVFSRFLRYNDKTNYCTCFSKQSKYHPDRENFEWWNFKNYFWLIVHLGPRFWAAARACAQVDNMQSSLVWHESF